ncbi:MAG: hypothetical protein ACJ71Q_12845 [Terriglobales bacterium]
MGQLDFGGTLYYGAQNGSNATIYVVGDLRGGASSMTTGLQQITNATANWQAVPNSTVNYNIQGVPAVPSGTASASSPVIIFQYGDPSEFQANGTCAGFTACMRNPPQMDAQGHVTIAQVDVNPDWGPTSPYFQGLMDHEMGHVYAGLADCFGCNSNETVMAHPTTSTTDYGPSACDMEWFYDYSNGSYGINPDGGDQPGGGGDCGCGCDGSSCDTNDGTGGPSPIILDVDGGGFRLTDLSRGVSFDLDSDGDHTDNISWIAEGFNERISCP